MVKPVLIKQIELHFIVFLEESHLKILSSIIILVGTVITQNVLFLTIASVESARKYAANENYHTTDEERLGRGKRQHIPNNRFNSDEECDSPQSVKHKNKSTYHKMFYVVFNNCFMYI